MPIDSFNREVLSVTRNTSPSKISETTGETVEGHFKVISIVCVVRPKTGSQRNNDMRGSIVSQQLELYSNEALKTDADGGYVADCFQYQGCDYKVVEVSDNSKTMLPHFVSLAEKVEAY